MEDLYTLPDGSTVDISKYSQLQRMQFLLDNEGAKKSKGGTKSAVVTPRKNKALTKDTVSKSVSGPSTFQKFRLPTVEELQKKGEAPPPSESANKSVVDLSRLYNMVGNTGNKVNQQDLKFATTKGKKEQADKGYFTMGSGAVDDLVESIDNPSNKKNQRRDLKYGIDVIKNKIQLTDSDLLNPYLYYSSNKKGIDDGFVDKNYSSKELKDIGVDPDDFDGYLNKKGYKEDFLKKESQGLYEGTGNATLARYDISLAKELAKKKMLNMYMEDMQRRDFTRQDLNQDMEIAFGIRDKKEIVQNELFNTNNVSKYVEKNFPTVTQKLKDRDIENRKIYDESKKGGTDFFSWDTLGKMGKSGWNAITDRTKQISASIYDTLGMDATAEGIRALDEENKFIRPDDRGVSYASGKSVSYKGTKYLVDSKGEIYDTDAKIRVTDLFNESEYKNIIETSKYAPSDFVFSTQGAAVQTSGVMADMLIQAAVTRGIGRFGTIASEARIALNGARQTSKFTSILNDGSQLLRKIPIDRATGYSMIAQGALGYSQGYEDTLKEARDAGINDTEAFKLAATSAQRMAILYSTTGAINPQTKLVENVFGSKNIIKKAIDQYLKTGEKGFVAYIDDIIKSTPRNLVEFAEEGGKEVIQENIQQAGELGVNRLTNQEAGKKIMNDVMTGDDFMNTSILSFISSGLISKAKIPSFSSNDENVDNLTSLNTLAKNKKEFVKIIDGLVDQKVFTVDQAKTLKDDVNIYDNNVNKIPKSISPEIAMPVMRELDKVTKLQNEKESVDKAFHFKIDEKIDQIRQNILDIEYASDLKVKNEQILRAIKKGVAKGISTKSFSTTEEVNNYLINEVGIPESEVSLYSSQGGFALSSTTLKKYSKDPNSIPENSQLIIVNESKSRDAGVIQHEFLHGVLQNTLKENPEAQKLIGNALAKELLKINENLKKKGSDESALPVEYAKRLGAYMERNTKDKAEAIARYEINMREARNNPSKMAEIKAKHNDYMGGLDGVFWEEAIVLYSDALRRGYVTYDEGTFTKLGDTIRRVLQYLGIKDIKFNSGKDVYNFLKDYNNSVETGNWGKALTKMSNKGAKIGLKSDKDVTKSKSSVPQNKFSLSERKSADEIKKDVNKNYNKDTFASKINSERDSSLYNILQEYNFIIKGKAKSLGYANTPDYSEMDMIMETQMALIPHIRNFNKEFLQKREEYKEELISKGFEPNSKEFKDKVQAQDEKGYQGKKGIVKENDDLNAWINSQLGNKMKVALNTGNVTTQKFTEDVEGEMFKESNISDGFGGDEGYLMDEGSTVFEAEQDFDQEQSELAILLNDPVFRFTDEKGNYISIETIPAGLYVTDASDADIPANRKLKTETDPVKIKELKKDISDLKRGLELESKKDRTFEENKELEKLKSFKSFNLSTLNLENTFKALSTEGTPAKIVVEEVAREILRSPNIETLEFRNFKERLSDISKTMMKRMTFETGEGLESLMYNNWDLIYDVINHPVDPVTGESSYASKKLPPTLKEFDDKGNLRKVSDITRVKFLQAFYEIEDVVRIINKFGGKNADKEIQQIGEREINPQTGKKLSQNAHFDRRTALRELFGDVMVLQEARRLLRNPEFLDEVAEKNVNLYNSLKDDTVRIEVLNNMAKGKSDIVKFSLVEQTQGQYQLLDIAKLLKTQEALSKGIVNNIYYSTESMPVLNDIVKFSLSEVIDQESDPELPIKEYSGYNKKYENNYKDIYDRNTGDIQYLDASKNYYIKALQYSDTVDTEPGSVKLHTLKNYEEVETEVVKRTVELIDSMDISIENSLGLINPFLIQEYKEDYIDRMLEKAINENDQAYIDHFTALKNNYAYREQVIIKNQELQYASIQSLLESVSGRNDFVYVFLGEEGDGPNSGGTLTSAWHNGVLYDNIQPGSDDWNNGAIVKYEKPNGLKLNPFFTYLFLNDVLSNRYTSNPIEQTVERKPFKRSQYKTTLTPIDSYTDEELIEKVYSGYSHIELKNPAFVYGFLNMQKNGKYVINWENDRKVLDFNSKKTFKFKKSNKEEDILSLNSLASRNINSNALWCTGQRSLSFATEHLENGNFFIVSDNDYTPVIAVRFDDRTKTGVGEVVGVEQGQSFKIKEMPLISEVFKLSDITDKQKYTDSIDLAYLLLTNANEVDFKNNSKEKNSELINNISFLNRGNFFRFELEKDSREELEDKISDIKTKLRKLDLINKVKDIKELLDSNYQIFVDGYEELDVLKEQEEITQETLELDIDDEYITIDFRDGKLDSYDLPNLIKIDNVEFKNAFGFNAPNLRKGNILSVQGKMMEGRAFLELPDSVNYNLTADAKIEYSQNEFEDIHNEFWFSMEPIDLNKGVLNLVTTFDTVENSSIDIASANNSSEIYIYGLANDVYLPKEVENLTLSFGEHDSIIPEKVALRSAQNIRLLKLNSRDSYTEAKVKEIDFINKFVLQPSFNVVGGGTIDKLKIEIREKLTDELRTDILNSSLGLNSKSIDIREAIFDNDSPYGGSYHYITTTIKDNRENNEIIRFSLAEESNGKISDFLQGLNIGQQWVVARDIDKAVLNGKLSETARNAEVDNITTKMAKETDPEKLEELRDQLKKTQQSIITFRVPSRSKMSDKSTAYFIISKIAEGYNNFEFRVKKNAEGPLTKQVLDAIYFNNKKDKKASNMNSNLEVAMNDIIEENTGTKSSEKFSAETAKNIGKNVGKNEFYLPPEDEDFLGLIYTLASAKGKAGEAQLKFFEDNLLKPYSNAMLNLMKARQTMYKDWKDLIKNKHKGITKLLKQDSGYEGYTIDQAVRVYLWNKAPYDIPGLDSRDKFNLVQLVRSNKKLRDFATDVSLLSKQPNGYIEPDNNWGFGSVVGDINTVISKSNRKKYLEQWQNNVDKIFSKDNMSKIEAIYGRQYADALRNILDRMETGSNRQKGSSDSFMNWINGATADVMWWNVRSAALQTLGAINYINTSDNNILKASKAFLNMPQFTEDFMTIWRSDYSKDRRSGLMNDVAEAEFAQMMNDPRNKSIGDKLKTANYWLLKNGFNATRFMDSFAIALGGATFYRNRLETYKKQGLSDEEAKTKTMSDFYDVSEQSQQSADVSKISKNQASTRGRLLLAFLNTPFQYSRLIKKSVIDLAKGRGSVRNNISKIAYYAVIQNVIFNVLQNALFTKVFGDDDEDELTTAEVRTINGAFDTLLRGAGLTGVLMSTTKNAIIKALEKAGIGFDFSIESGFELVNGRPDPKGYGDVLLELANFAPAIGTKAREIAKAYKALTYNKDEIMYKGFSLDNQYAIEAITSLTTARYNIPLDRMYQKSLNIKAALDAETETWQRVFLLLGYSEWNLGMETKDEEPETNARSLKKSGLSRGGLKKQGLR